MARPHDFAAEYERLAGLWAQDHWPEHERRGIWLAYEDWLFEEILTLREGRMGSDASVDLANERADWYAQWGADEHFSRPEGMSRAAYEKRFVEILDEMRAVTMSKNANYANDSDAFANFRLIETLSNGRITTADGLLTRISDKLQRLVNLAGGAENNHESFADNCLDLAIYAIILRIAKESRHARPK